MIPVKSIALTRATGPNHEVDRTVTVATFSEANWQLRKWATTAPEHGGYDKCDFRVTYEDGNTYEGRYDLVHWRREIPDLGRHMRAFLGYLSGRQKPAWMADALWAEVRKRNEAEGHTEPAAKFLDTYEIG